MSMTYFDCQNLYASRRKGRYSKRVSHNQVLLYDKQRDCYQHKHHSTITVEIFQDKYRVSTGGWDTVTTWRKICQYVPISVTRYRIPKSAIGNKFVVWGNHNDRKYAEFYDGIEIDAHGVPLDIQPVQFRVMKRGACAEFNALARDVRDYLMPRILLGEFEELDGDPEDGDDLLDLMRAVQAHSGGLFPEYMPTDVLAPLFVRRPIQCWGRQQYWMRVLEHQPAIRNLQSNLAAAKREWMDRYLDSDDYETITKDCS